MITLPICAQSFVHLTFKVEKVFFDGPQTQNFLHDNLFFFLIETTLEKNILRYFLAAV